MYSVQLGCSMQETGDLYSGHKAVSVLHCTVCTLLCKVSSIYSSVYNVVYGIVYSSVYRMVYIIV